MTKRPNDEVQRLRRVREQLVREHGGRDRFFDWIQEQDAQRTNRKKKAAKKSTKPKS